MREQAMQKMSGNRLHFNYRRNQKTTEQLSVRDGAAAEDETIGIQHGVLAFDQTGHGLVDKNRNAIGGRSNLEGSGLPIRGIVRTARALL